MLLKRVKIFIGLKKTCLGVLDRGERDKDDETCLKEGGVIEMSTTVLHSRAAPSLEYLLSVSDVFDLKLLNSSTNISIFSSNSETCAMALSRSFSAFN